MKTKQTKIISKKLISLVTMLGFRGEQDLFELVAKTECWNEMRREIMTCYFNRGVKLRLDGFGA